jgi:hypothetical protein
MALVWIKIVTPEGLGTCGRLRALAVWGHLGRPGVVGVVVS